MKSFFFNLFCIAGVLTSCIESPVERIEIEVDNKYLNPIQKPNIVSNVKVYSYTADGVKQQLSLDDVALSINTVNASGNVEVASLSNGVVKPLAGGIAEISAVYIEDNQTFMDKEKVIVTPYYRDYHQTLVMKLFMAYDGKPMEKNKSDACFQQTDPSRICTFAEALDVVKKVDNITRGIPKIIYLIGWQQGGHDHLYPDWSIVNPKLKREQDASALESLRWLIREAKKYNTTISLHINMVDAFKESPLWKEYVAKGIIARDEKGDLLPSWENVENHEAYHISYTKEWEYGLSQKRIDKLIEMVPELKEGHTIHVDAFIALWEGNNLHPYLAKNEGIDANKEVETQRKIFNYWREKGFDVTGEGLFWAHPAGEGFVGLQPMAWWYPDDKNFQMEVPERLSARGRVSRTGQGDFRFGSSMQGEDIFLKDKENLPGFIEQFCTMTLPWYYLSRLERIAFVNEELFYSDGVVARKEDGRRIIRKGDFILRDNDDLFVPALWNDKEIIAFSKEGYQQRSWKMPEDWNNVQAVDLYEISLTGCELKKAGVPVVGSELELSLSKGEAISIVPAGVKLNK